MEWLEFSAAGLLFLVSHRMPTIPRFKRPLLRALGRPVFGALYSALSLATLAWLILAAGRAPYVALWDQTPASTWAPMLVTPVACLFAAFWIGAPNPLSFGGGRDAEFDPLRPGPVGFARHGLLWALALWSGAHIAPNGDLAHVVLFSVFTVFALVGMVMIDRRKRREFGPAAWDALAARTSFWPGQALAAGRWRPTGPFVTLSIFARLAAAALLYLGLLSSHTWVIGVSPLPAPG